MTAANDMNYIAAMREKVALLYLKTGSYALGQGVLGSLFAGP